MENYMDETFVVAHNTIISYNGQHPAVKVPERFGDIPPVRIGDGSFMESNALQCVVLPPTTKEIGAKAFYGCSALTNVFVPSDLTRIDGDALARCDNLSDITIYNVELTAHEYHVLKNDANRTEEGVYVLHEMPRLEPVQRILASGGIPQPACCVPHELTALFQLVGMDEQRGKFSLDKNIPVFGFQIPSTPVTESKAFCQHVQSGVAEVYDSDVEQKNDWYVRTGKTPTIMKTTLFTFDDTLTKEQNGKFLIRATLKIGYFFWQSAQSVIYDRKRYFVYRRYYLSANPEVKYIRRDIAIYAGERLVTNREEAQKVYAKYKLLSIL